MPEPTTAQPAAEGSPPFRKVLIAGAGPVGLLIALRLARAGIDVTVLEADTKLNGSPRAAHYSRPAILELKKAGVLPDCRAKGITLKDVRWCTVDGQTIAGLKNRDLDDELRALCVDQALLGGIIVQHLKPYSNARILWSHRVVGVSQDEKGVRVECETPEGRKVLEGDYLVGADGAGSSVRKLLGLPFEGKTWDEMVVATNVRYPFEQHGWWETNFIVDPTHWALICRLTADGVWRMSYGEPGGYTREEMIARQPAKYAAILPGPEPKEYKLENISPYKLHQRCAPTFRVGRVVLAGDAAHVCNPFGGMGLTGGLCDAGGLADCLIGMYQGLADDKILDSYSQIRRQIFLDVINPVTSENKLRLHAQDPKLAAEKDPMLKQMNEANGEGATEEMKQRYLEEGQKMLMSLQYDFSQLFKTAPKVSS